VIVDAGWAKRTYGHSYSSNAGVAIIIGSRTKKPLFVDDRVKACVICQKRKAESEEEETDNNDDHICYRNWDGTSQGMEADIIVDGFRKSLSEHGLIYRYMVGDGDSSVYGQIQSRV